MWDLTKGICEKVSLFCCGSDDNEIKWFGECLKKSVDISAGGNPSFLNINDIDLVSLGITFASEFDNQEDIDRWHRFREKTTELTSHYNSVSTVQIMAREIAKENERLNQDTICNPIEPHYSNRAD